MLRNLLPILAVSGCMWSCCSGTWGNYNQGSLVSLDPSASGNGSPPPGVASQTYTKCPGKDINNYIITTYKVRSFLTCARDCMVHKHCRSAVVCKDEKIKNPEGSASSKSGESDDSSNESAQEVNPGNTTTNKATADDSDTQAGIPSFDASQTDVSPDDVIPGNTDLRCSMTVWAYYSCDSLPGSNNFCTAIIMKHWCKNGGRPTKYKWLCECPLGFEGAFCQRLASN